MDMDVGKETIFFFFLQLFYVLDKNRCSSVVQGYKEAKIQDEKIFNGRSGKGGVVTRKDTQ